MDPLNIVRADGGSLLPVVIFIIYIIFTVIGATQKKKKKQMHEERRRRETVSQPKPASVSYNKPARGLNDRKPRTEEPKTNDVMDQIKRELEMVLGNQKDEGESISPEKESESLETVSYERTVTPPPVTMEVTIPEVSPVSVMPIPVHSTFSYDESALYDHDQNAVVTVDLASLDEARKGIVWSEILGPCKALRDT
jgi:hypothetical protein